MFMTKFSIVNNKVNESKTQSPLMSTTSPVLPVSQASVIIVLFECFKILLSRVSVINYDYIGILVNFLLNFYHILLSHKHIQAIFLLASLNIFLYEQVGWGVRTFSLFNPHHIRQ